VDAKAERGKKNARRDEIIELRKSSKAMARRDEVVRLRESPLPLRREGDSVREATLHRAFCPESQIMGIIPYLLEQPPPRYLVTATRKSQTKAGGET
jgi:hypothetical protein